MRTLGKASFIAIFILALGCMISSLVYAGTAINLQSASHSFGTPTVTWQPRRGGAWIDIIIPTYYFAYFTVNLYDGVSSTCSADTNNLSTWDDSALPYPGAMPPNANSTLTYSLRPSKNINTTGNVIFLCVAVNDSTGYNLTSSATELNFSQIPSTTTTSTSTSTTSTTTASTTIGAPYNSTISTSYPTTSIYYITSSVKYGTTYYTTSITTVSVTSHSSSTSIRPSSTASTTSIRTTSTATTTIPQSVQASVIISLRSLIARIFRFF